MIPNLNDFYYLSQFLWVGNSGKEQEFWLGVSRTVAAQTRLSLQGPPPWSLCVLGLPYNMAA